tara:strand:+ start:851 stop:1780 length:930 start_codon:yes stop_codon:yes gene_type:complete
MKYFYGPVPSRRLGFSLGVDFFADKSCTFDCLYCQLGKSTKHISKRINNFDLKAFKSQLKEIFKSKPRIDYITISGSGEPTLQIGLDKIIKIIKKETSHKYSVCVITNSSLIHRKSIRRELLAADIIIPSLDAAYDKSFKKINRPGKGTSLTKIISGLIALRKEFRGAIWLEIMLAKGINDSLKEAKRFKELIKKIKPDKVQLNLPVRPSDYKVSLPDKEKIKKIKAILSEAAEVVSDFRSKRRAPKIDKDLTEALMSYLKVRPASIEDLISSLGKTRKDTLKQLNTLIAKKVVRLSIHKNKKYYRLND